jgi:20S proteasome alpha/beta subunit
MTICVATLCSDDSGNQGQALVLASDRMQTFGYGEIRVEKEDASVKVFELGNGVVAGVAGDARKGSFIVEAGRRHATSSAGASVAAIADTMAAEVHRLRRLELEESVFGVRGLSMTAFYGGQQRELNDQIAAMLDSQAANWQFGVNLLVAAVDSDGGHLLTIGHPGPSAMNCTPNNHIAVGDGWPLALFTLRELGQAPNSSIARSLLNVYLAKRRAEAAPGVGTVTDLYVIRAGHTTLVDTIVLRQISDLCAAHLSHAASDLDDRARGLHLRH